MQRCAWRMSSVALGKCRPHLWAESWVPGVQVFWTLWNYIHGRVGDLLWEHFKQNVKLRSAAFIRAVSTAHLHYESAHAPSVLSYAKVFEMACERFEHRRQSDIKFPEVEAFVLQQLNRSRERDAKIDQPLRVKALHAMLQIQPHLERLTFAKPVPEKEFSSQMPIGFARGAYRVFSMPLMRE
jgi:hypothetical protein